MDFLPKEKYKKILVLSFYIFVGGLLVFLFFKYLLKLFLPFIVAWIVALCIRPLAEILHNRTHISKKVISIFLVVLLLFIIGAFLFFVIDKLLFEFRGIVQYVNKNSELWISDILKYVNTVLAKIPFLKTFGSEEEMLNSFGGVAKNILTDASANVPEMLTRVITILPNLLFVSLVLIMASYYFCADYEEINSYIFSRFSDKTKHNISRIRVKLKQAALRVLKGYLLTIGITFLQLYAGFLILKTEYAFTLALIVAVVDILPVIGVGTVLVPWGIVKILSGGYYQGFGLLIIFAVVSVVREILEPKIIGKSIGLHPLMTLLSMYIGLELCGFLGLISFPVLVIVLKTLFLEGEHGICSEKT
ncbi:MAG: sporulation integral membrane protein YtvI [Clostridia bacterium]|nr:sporulation integral membrane protein YtvI [Clostridia bacterium]